MRHLTGDLSTCSAERDMLHGSPLAEIRQGYGFRGQARWERGRRSSPSWRHLDRSWLLLPGMGETFDILDADTAARTSPLRGGEINAQFASPPAGGWRGQHTSRSGLRC